MTFSANTTRLPFTGRPRNRPFGRQSNLEPARDVRRFADHQFDAESEVWDLGEIALEHCSIAGEAERPAVVAHVVLGELTQIGPILPVQAGDIVSVDIREGGFGHGGRPCGLEKKRRLSLRCREFCLTGFGWSRPYAAVEHHHLRLDGLVGARAGRRQPAPRRPQHQVLSVGSAADLVRRRDGGRRGREPVEPGDEARTGRGCSSTFTPI